MHTLSHSYLPSQLRDDNYEHDSNVDRQPLPVTYEHPPTLAPDRPNGQIARPENWKVGNQSANVATTAKPAAIPLDNTRHRWTTLEDRPSRWITPDGPGRFAHYYGSDAPDTNQGRRSVPMILAL